MTDSTAGSDTPPMSPERRAEIEANVILGRTADRWSGNAIRDLLAELRRVEAERDVLAVRLADIVRSEEAARRRAYFRLSATSDEDT